MNIYLPCTKVLSYFRTTLLRVQLYSVQLYTAIEYVSCTLYMYNNTKVRKYRIPSKIEYFRKYESTFESKILSYESTFVQSTCTFVQYDTFEGRASRIDY